MDGSVFGAYSLAGILKAYMERTGVLLSVLKSVHGVGRNVTEHMWSGQGVSEADKIVSECTQSGYERIWSVLEAGMERTEVNAFGCHLLPYLISSFPNL
jgi:hypothetical protein